MASAVIETKTPGHKRPLIDSGTSLALNIFRFLAINMVVFDHCSHIFFGKSGYSTHGSGVVVFFLMSGFLITKITVRRWGDGTQQLSAFLINRFSRIMTPLIPALLLTVGLNEAFALPHSEVLGVSEGWYAFLGNIILINDYPMFQLLSHFAEVGDIFPRSYNGSESFWTIPIEFWTYVCFAAIAYVVIKGEKPRAFEYLLFLIAAPVVIWNGFAGGAGDLSLIWLTGSIVGLVWGKIEIIENGRLRLAVIMLIFGAICLIGRSGEIGYIPYDFQENISIALLFFGIILAFSAMGEPRAWIVSIFTKLSQYSYSLFLVHNIILITMYDFLPSFGLWNSIFLSICVSHILAIVFYILFERHYHRVARYFTIKLVH
jgi:peptidoglycan/LPS O-acetylase OafA/YrhL